MIKLHFSYIKRCETLDKKKTPAYRLVDKVLAKAAGSSSLKSQLKVLEVRWMYVGKRPLFSYTMNFNTLNSAIEILSREVEENSLRKKS